MERFVQNYTNQYIHRFLFTHLSLYKKIIDQLISQPPKLIEGYSPIYRLAYIIDSANNNNSTFIMQELMALLKQISIGNISLTSKQWDEFLLKHSSEQTEVEYESSEEVVYF